MDEVLSQRYMALFLAYDVGERGELADLKQRLREASIKLLRPDAALMLLLLYDQMILRPYTGSIQWRDIQPPLGPSLPLPHDRA